MSLLVWVFYKIFTRKEQKYSRMELLDFYSIAAGLFAAGHLPATTMFFGELTGMILFFDVFY